MDNPFTDFFPFGAQYHRAPMYRMSKNGRKN